MYVCYINHLRVKNIRGKGNIFLLNTIKKEKVTFFRYRRYVKSAIYATSNISFWLKTHDFFSLLR